MTESWQPNEHTEEMIYDFLQALFWRLPYIMGIDEMLNDCEVVNVDPEAAGLGTYPRQVTVTIKRYHQLVTYRGMPDINVGDIVTVAHFRQGDLYEIIGAGGGSGSSTFPPGLIGGWVRGAILRGGTTAWEVYLANTLGAALVGDGTDIISTTNPTWGGLHTFPNGLHSDDDVVVDSDAAGVLLGDGQDMEIDYTGVVGRIRTDLVGASDLDIDCGTARTTRLVIPVWDDLVITAESFRLAGASPATAQAYRSGYVLAFTNVADRYCYFNFQLPHTYVEGTDVKFHIHWTIPVSGAGAGAENVKWDFTYSASSPNALYPETWPAASTATVTIDVQNDAVNEHLVDTIVTISGAGFTISEVLICSLMRDTTVANNYGNPAYLVSADLHIQVDTSGSRQEWVK